MAYHRFLWYWNYRVLDGYVDNEHHRSLHSIVRVISIAQVIVKAHSRFLQAQSYAGFICFLAWASGSMAYPASKRAVGLALLNTVSSLGNVFGS